MRAGRRVTILPVARRRSCHPLPTPGFGAESRRRLRQPLLCRREPAPRPPGSVPAWLGHVPASPGELEATGAPVACLPEEPQPAAGAVADLAARQGHGRGKFAASPKPWVAPRVLHLERVSRSPPRPALSESQVRAGGLAGSVPGAADSTVPPGRRRGRGLSPKRGSGGMRRRMPAASRRGRGLCRAAAVSPISRLSPPRHVAPGTQAAGLGCGDRSDRKQKPFPLSFLL